MGPKEFLTDAEEQVIVNLILSAQGRTLPVTKETIMSLISSLLSDERNYLEINPDGRFKCGTSRPSMPEESWYQLFLKRHPTIDVRMREYLSSSRRNVNQQDVKPWYAYICSYLAENDLMDILYEANRNFNINEAIFEFSPKESNLLAEKGSKIDNELDRLTVLVNIGANGSLLPPLIIYPKVAAIGKIDSGQINNEILYEYLCNGFDGWLTYNNIQRPVIVWIDKHESQMQYHLVKRLAELQIILILTPPNTSYFMQPIDVEMLTPMKEAWVKCVNNFRSLNPNGCITKENFASIFLPMYASVISQDKIKDAFRKCGIHPFDVKAPDYSKLTLKPTHSSYTAFLGIEQNSMLERGAQITSSQTWFPQSSESKINGLNEIAMTALGAPREIISNGYDDTVCYSPCNEELFFNKKEKCMQFMLEQDLNSIETRTDEPKPTSCMALKFKEDILSSSTRKGSESQCSINDSSPGSKRIGLTLESTDSVDVDSGLQSAYSIYEENIESVDKQNSTYCNNSDKTFSTNSGSNQHILSIHNESNKNKCSICDLTFVLKATLYTHVKTVHGKINLFKCFECNQSFRLKSILTRHINTVHKKLKQFKCTYCNFTSSKVGNLDRHTKSVHMKIKPFKCWICNHSCSEKSSLLKHVKVVHYKLKSFKCDDTFSKNASLNEHTLGAHNQLKPVNLNCWEEDLSSYSIKPQDNLTIESDQEVEIGLDLGEKELLCPPIKINVDDLRDQQEEIVDTELLDPLLQMDVDAELLCTSLQDNSAKKTKLELDLSPDLVKEEWEDEKYSYSPRSSELNPESVLALKFKEDILSSSTRKGSESQCSINDSSPGSKRIGLTLESTDSVDVDSGLQSAYSIYEENIESVDKQNSTYCNKSDKTFSTNSGSNKHILSIHNKSNKHICFICNLAFDLKATLSIHIKTVHEKIQLFKCFECNQSFILKSSLTKHINTVHKKLKLFKCTYCNYTSNLMGNLDRHTKSVHMKIKPFKCWICNYLCSEKSSLLKHVKVVHYKLKSFKCDDTFSKNASLNEHILGAHNQLKPVNLNCWEEDLSSYSIKPQDNLTIESDQEVEIGLDLGEKELLCPPIKMDVDDLQDQQEEIVDTELLDPLLQMDVDAELLCTSLQDNSAKKTKLELDLSPDLVKEEWEDEKYSYSPRSSELNPESVLALKFKEDILSISTRKGSASQCSINDSSPGSKRIGLTLESTDSVDVDSGLQSAYSIYEENIESVDKQNSTYCNTSDHKFSTKNGLNHILSFRNKSNEHKCSICDLAFDKKATLSIHIKTVHEKIQPFKCFECIQSFCLKSSLTKHIKTVHKKLKQLKCTHRYCNYTTSVIGNFIRHMKSVHDKIKLFKCWICNHLCSEKFSLLKHVKVVHYELKSFKCDDTFSKNASLNEHILGALKQLKPVNLNCWEEDLSSYSIKPQDNLTIESDHEEEIGLGLGKEELLNPSIKMDADDLRDQGKEIVYKELFDPLSEMNFKGKLIGPSLYEYSAERVKPEFDPPLDLEWKDSLLVKEEWEVEKYSYSPGSSELNPESVLVSDSTTKDGFRRTSKTNLYPFLKECFVSVERLPKKFTVNDVPKYVAEETGFKFPEEIKEQIGILSKSTRKGSDIHCSIKDTSPSSKTIRLTLEPTDNVNVESESKSAYSICEENIDTVDKQNSTYCNKCDRTFRTKNNLKRHILAIHETKCCSCEFVVSENETLSEHIMSVHKNSNQHKCPNCELSFDLKGTLSMHLKIDHSPNVLPFKCAYCDFAAGYWSCLISHVKSVHGKLPFKCLKCNYSCSCKSNLVIHVKAVHEKLKPFKCLECNYSCFSKHTLNNHTKSVHLKLKPFKCLECNYSCSQKCHLESHVKFVHEKIKRFKCLECNRSFSLKSHLAVHIASVHDKIKPFKCLECNYSCFTKHTLTNHTKSVHLKIKPFKCLECNYSCSQKSALVIHIKSVHNKIKPFKCLDCNYSFSHKQTLTNHTKSIHLKIKPFKCLKCNRSYSQKGSLTVHMKAAHIKIKPFRCLECNYSFRHKQTLTNHTKSFHLKIKPFKCLECNYSCSLKDTLTYHMMSVHLKIKPFKCLECDYSCITKANLLRHVDSAHKKIKSFKCLECNNLFSQKRYLASHIKSVHDKTKPFKCME